MESVLCGHLIHLKNCTWWIVSRMERKEDYLTYIGTYLVKVRSKSEKACKHHKMASCIVICICKQK